MRGIFIVFVLFSAIAVFSANARWSEWRNATICDARPCNCTVNKKETCKHGHLVQVRICLRDGNSGMCKFDTNNIGSIQKVECMNGPETCPGWSKWAFPEECDCTDKQNGIKFAKRYCNNPPPIHPEVLCFSIIDNVPSMMEEDPDNSANCSCIDDIVSTTKSPVPEPVTEEDEQPCCITESAVDVAGNDSSVYDVYGEDYGGGQDPIDANAFGGPDLPSSDLNSEDKEVTYGLYDYDYSPVCRYGNGCPEKPDEASSEGLL